MPPRPAPRLCRRLLFARLTFDLQAAWSQQFAHVEQHDQASCDLAQSRHAVQAAFLKHCRRSFHGVGWNLQDFGSRIDDQPGQPAGVLDHQNAILFPQRGLLFSETLAQVHDRNDLAAQVDHALQIVGRVGHGSDLGHPHDFVQGSDGHAIGLASHLKAHDMEFTAHDFQAPQASAL